MPHTFTDAESRQFEIRLTVGSCTQIKAATKLDITNSIDPSNFTRLIEDRNKLSEALWIVVEKQANELEVTKDDFYYALDGAALDAATTAMQGSYIELCPPAARDAVTKFLKTHREAQDAATSVFAERIGSSEVTEHITREINAAMDKAFSGKR